MREGHKELRKMHDTMVQNLRALKKTMDCVMNRQIVTSMIQAKVDQMTLFTWKDSSKDQVERAPHCDEILRFLKQRATSESSTQRCSKPPPPVKSVTAHIASNPNQSGKCQLCQGERHPFYICPAFKEISLDKKQSSLTAKNACFNCMKVGHRASQC